MSIVELMLADRKFGIFSGGFGVSRKLDTGLEILIFFAAYALSQLMVVILVWWFVRSARGGVIGWGVVWQFLLLFGGIFFVSLLLNYQLHSYFSDAVSFALIKQLGGGSILDALKFGFVEILIGLFALVVFASLYVFFRRLIRSRAVYEAEPVSHRRFSVVFFVVFFGFLAASWVVPRIYGDSSFGLMRVLVWKNANWLLNEATDFDQDGYGSFSAQFDPSPFNASVHPLALDIPGNGVDEDGFGGDLQLVEIPQLPPTIKASPLAKHLVIVVMESTRGDVIGKKIGGRVVAPNLEALARQGSVYPAYSHIGFTVESLKSIFSGSIVNLPGMPSLFSELRDGGYRVGVFSAQSEDFGGIATAVHMRSSGDVFVDAETLKENRAFGFAAQGSLRIDEHFLLEEFRTNFGASKDWSRPNFLYFNFQSPHFPYHHESIPPVLLDKPIPRAQINESNKEWVAQTYWNSVSYSDRWLGVLIDELKKLDVWDETILVVTGDHGEELFDSGFLGHGHSIGKFQNQTFFATSVPVKIVENQLSLSDYRAVIHSLLMGERFDRKLPPPLMHVGSFQRPNQIGMVAPDGEILTLRTDSRIACLGLLGCRVYDDLQGPERQKIDGLVSRWASERWMFSQKK